MDSNANRLCRDCGHIDRVIGRTGMLCRACGSARLVNHPELSELGVAHVDCDAYYATVEKRDRPELADQPVIVGGGAHGVVTTCCYVARRFGVRSAMPMSQALQLCPGAVVIRPDMEKYRFESQRIAALMREATPIVEQVSIDEAYLDFTRPDSGRSEPPARALARLSLLIEKRVGVTVSVGLAPNKMLAKLASDLDKPRGFAVIGRSDALRVIAPMKVQALPGVGPVMSAKLAELGIHLVSDLRAANAGELIHRFGVWARRLIDYANAEDPRRVSSSRRRAISISTETTFDAGLCRFEELDAALAPLCQQLSRRLESSGHAAAGLTLKLRRADRTILTRACRLHQPTLRPDVLHNAARRTLAAQLDGAAYRLIGVCAAQLVPARLADPPDLFAEAG